MRIWHQSVTDLEALPRYAESLARRFATVAGPGVEVVLHGVPSGTYGASSPAQALEYPFERNRIAQIVLDQLAGAEREGFDAVMLATFAEPALREARSVLDIPVTSMMESCLLAACSVAPLIGIVTISPSGARMLRDSVRRHRLEARVAAIASLNPAADEFALQQAFENPSAVIAAFRETCADVIAAGADIIVPGEGVLNELLVSLGLHEVDGVAIMDATLMTLVHTEMLVRAYGASLLRTGRRWEYPKAPPEVRSALAAPRKGS